MRHFFLTVLFLMGFLLGFSQTDIPATKPLKIETDPTGPNKAPTFKFPSNTTDKNTYDLNLFSNKNEVKMLPDRKLLQAGYDLKLDPKIGEKENGDSKTHYGNQYLGDVKSNAKFIGIVYRDHEYVDGDRVKIYANGKVIVPNALLTGSFKGINLDLQNGFNQIEFEALNQGSSGPNTAQVNVYDDKGQLIQSSKWNLSTGSKATLIVVKEDQ